MRKSIVKSLKFQQNQSEQQQKFNAEQASNQNSTQNSTNYTLDVTKVPFGSRDLCYGFLSLNCAQFRFTLAEKINEVSKIIGELEMALTVERDAYKKDNKNSGSLDARAAFLRDCLQNKDKLQKTFGAFLQKDFLNNKTRNEDDIACTYVGQYIKDLRLVLRTTPVSDTTCRGIIRRLEAAMLECEKEASKNLAMLYLLIVLVIPLAYGVGKGYNYLRKNHCASLPDITGCVAAICSGKRRHSHSTDPFKFNRTSAI